MHMFFQQVLSSPALLSNQYTTTAGSHHKHATGLRRLGYYFALYQDEEEHTIHDNTWDTWHGYNQGGQFLNWAPCKFHTPAPAPGQLPSCDLVLDQPFSYNAPHTLPFVLHLPAPKSPLATAVMMGICMLQALNITLNQTLLRLCQKTVCTNK